MPIKVVGDQSLEQKIVFSYSPYWELMFSLHVLRNAKHHGLHLQWAVQTKRRMDRRMLGELRYFGKGFREYLSLVDVIMMRPELELRNFDEELQEVASLPGPEFAARVLSDNAEREEVACAMEDNEAMEKLLERFPEEPETEDRGSKAPYGHCSPKACRQAQVKELLTDPARVRDRLVDFAGAYWTEIFAPEFERLESWFLSDITERARTLRISGAVPMLAGISDRLSLDREAGELVIYKHHEITLDGSALETITISPSYFGAPHLITSVNPGHLVICYDVVAASARKQQSAIPPARLVALMRAVGDEVRLSILKLVSEERRTTQELAQILSITPPSVSRHLRILKEAGLLTSQGEGYYVYYSLVPHEVAALGRYLGDFLNISNLPRPAEAREPMLRP